MMASIYDTNTQANKTLYTIDNDNNFEDLTKSVGLFDLNEDYDSEPESHPKPEPEPTPTEEIAETISEKFKMVKFVESYNSTSRKNGKNFKHFTLEDYEQLMNRNFFYCEYYQNQHIRPPFDVDKTFDKQPPDSEIKKLFDDHINLVCNLFPTHFPGFNKQLTMNDFAISTAHGWDESKNKYKFSIHMVLIGFSLLKWGVFKDIVKDNQLDGNNKKYKSSNYYFDMSVYKESDQCWRGLGMIKPEQENFENPRVLTPYNHQDKLYLHFPSFLVGDEKKLPRPVTPYSILVKQIPSSTNDKSTEDSPSSLPTDAPDLNFQEEVIEFGVLPTKPSKEIVIRCKELLQVVVSDTTSQFDYDNSQLNSLYFKTSSACGRTCCNGEKHTNNNFYLNIRGNKVYYNCLSAECQDSQFLGLLDESATIFSESQELRQVFRDLFRIQETAQFSDLLVHVPYCQNFKYSDDHEVWYNIENGLWIEGQHPMKRLKTIQKELFEIINEAKLFYPSSKEQKMYAIEKKISNGAFLESTLRNAQSDPAFLAENLKKKFDNDPEVFAFNNGKVINLVTREIRQAHVDDYISMHCGWDFEYESIDEVPSNDIFEQFINQIFPIKEERDFFQQLCGSLLLGSNMSQSIPFLIGDSANGKTKILNLIEKVMGDYSEPGDERFLFSNQKHKSASDHDTATVEFKDKRVSIYEEPNKNLKINQDNLKKMTGGKKKIKARRAHASQSEIFEFITKLLIALNKFPKFDTTDKGWLRRLLVILFRSKFAKNQEEFDKYTSEGYEYVFWANENIDDSFDSWRPVMFKWMLDGLDVFRVQKMGNVPEAFKACKEETIAEADPMVKQIDMLLEEEIIVKSNESEALTLVEAHKCYTKWHSGKSVGSHIGKKQFKQLLEQKIGVCHEQKMVSTIRYKNVWLGYKIDV